MRFSIATAWSSAELEGDSEIKTRSVRNGQSRNSGWYAGGGFDYMVHKGPLVDVVLGVEYQHFDFGSKNAFCFNPGCNPATGWDEDLSARGDIVRARLTVKTQGYRFFY
jgi:hypothetical protein